MVRFVCFAIGSYQSEVCVLFVSFVSSGFIVFERERSEVGERSTDFRFQIIHENLGDFTFSAGLFF